MAQAQVYEGTPEQLVKQFRKLPKTQKYRVTVISEEPETTKKQPQMITFGMFPALQALTEDDFKNAEWHGQETEF